jgi:DNA repair protein RecO (recombination protein O)
LGLLRTLFACGSHKRFKPSNLPCPQKTRAKLESGRNPVFQPRCDTLKFPRVPVRVSEALVLRTYPLKEADLVVSFLTRDQGKLRGVAKRARRPKSAFGAGLERLSHVRMSYYQRETRELVNLDSCELIHSQFDLVSDYWAALALDYFAEVSEQLLPFAEPNEKFFRLLLAVLDSLHHGENAAWRAVVYFSLWAVRLSGWLPELNVCLSCGTLLDDPESSAPLRAYFTRARTGLVCAHCRTGLGIGNTWELSAASRAIAEEMLRLPVLQISQTVWSADTASDLRRFLIQQIESHAERRLVTAPLFNTDRFNAESASHA